MRNISINLKNETGLAGLVIDMQPDFLEYIEEGEKEIMIQSQKEIIKKLSERGAPIIILEYEHKGRTIKELRREINFSYNGILIKKKKNDGFERTKLHSLLKRNHSEHIILMGINASYCVKQTAMSAVARGYNIYTARELIRDKEKLRGRETDRFLRRWYSDKGEYFRTEEQLWRYLVKNLSI